MAPTGKTHDVSSGQYIVVSVISDMTTISGINAATENFKLDLPTKTY